MCLNQFLQKNLVNWFRILIIFLPRKLWLEYPGYYFYNCALSCFMWWLIYLELQTSFRVTSRPECSVLGSWGRHEDLQQKNFCLLVQISPVLLQQTILEAWIKSCLARLSHSVYTMLWNCNCRFFHCTNSNLMLKFRKMMFKILLCHFVQWYYIILYYI